MFVVRLIGSLTGLKSRERLLWFWGWNESAEDFMGGKEFKGERFNACHYTIAVKLAAREAAKTGTNVKAERNAR